MSSEALEIMSEDHHHTPPYPLETNTLPMQIKAILDANKQAKPIEVEGNNIDSSYVFGHGKTFTSHQRKLAIEYLKKRDGKNCQICSQQMSAKELNIDHIDGVSNHHVAYNLRLAHHGCNSSQGWIQRLGKTRQLQQQSLSSDVKLQCPGSSTIALERQTHGNAVAAALSPSVEVDRPIEETIFELSRKNEKAFRRYWFERVLQAYLEKRSIGPSQLRRDAREHCGISRASSYSYQERMCYTDNGPLIVDEDATTGTRFLKFRNRQVLQTLKDESLKAAVEWLEQNYPTRGLMSKREEC